MPDHADDGRWFLEPPAPGEIHLHVDVGEGTEVSPQARAALERLVNELQDADTTGFLMGLGTDCLPMECNGYGKCRVYKEWPCAVRTWCRISD